MFAMSSKSINTVPATYDSHAVLEENHGQAIYGVAFDHFSTEENVFAAVGHNRATVYRCKPDGTFDFVQAYVDEDVILYSSSLLTLHKDDEEFYVCKWSVDRRAGRHLLVLGGKKGNVRVLDTKKNAIVNTLIGHGQSINDLTVFPSAQHLLLTASKDETARIWNLITGVTVCIVAGDDGHTAEVLSIDGHLEGNMFVTSGMDDYIKIWSLKGCSEKLSLSNSWNTQQRRRNFPTVVLNNIHSNYVDCVKWYGNLVVSKGVDERVVIFRPVDMVDDSIKTSSKFETLVELKLFPIGVWYVRFSMDLKLELLACGDECGKVHVWDMQDPTEIIKCELEQDDCNSVIRQTAVSADGSIILAACDSGQVWRWDRKKSEEAFVTTRGLGRPYGSAEQHVDINGPTRWRRELDQSEF